jgi:hypothetical protein
MDKATYNTTGKALVSVWNTIVSRATARRYALAVAQANAVARYGTVRWFETAIWKYNQG